eukprot:TRINITY_DN243_c0_g1_i1.p1 TRINITY_DN243_c0_g1~~TRINITY_DN243_c0_g1_i1.p1  ORF type:complete len:664 (-),score=206.34 TRINITY_DN243_c0_g1_i1:114-2105(-)
MSGRGLTPSRRDIRPAESPPLVDHPIEILQPWVEKAKKETIPFEDFLHDARLLSPTEEEEVRIPLLFVLSRCSFDVSLVTPVRTLVVPLIHESLDSNDGHGNLYGVTILQRLWENDSMKESLDLVAMGFDDQLLRCFQTSIYQDVCRQCTMLLLEMASMAETATEWLRRGFWFVFVDALGREKDVVTLRGILKILDSLCESCSLESLCEPTISNLSTVGSSCEDEWVKEMSMTLLKKLRERWIPSSRRKSMDEEGREHKQDKSHDESTVEKGGKDSDEQESDLKRQFNAKRVECLKFQKIASDWRKKYEELSMTYEHVKSQKENVEQRLKETEEELEEERAASLQTASSRIERKQSIDGDIKQEMERLRETCAHFEDELRQTESTSNDLRVMIEELKQENADVLDHLSESRHNEAQVREELRSLETECAILRREISAQEGELELSRERESVDSRSMEIRLLQKKNGELQLLLEETLSSLTQRDVQYQKLHHDIAERDKEYLHSYRTVESQLDRAVKLLHRLKQRNDSIGQTLHSIVRSLRSASSSGRSESVWYTSVSAADALDVVMHDIRDVPTLDRFCNLFSPHGEDTRSLRPQIVLDHLSPIAPYDSRPITPESRNLVPSSSTFAAAPSFRSDDGMFRSPPKRVAPRVGRMDDSFTPRDRR